MGNSGERDGEGHQGNRKGRDAGLRGKVEEAGGEI